MRIGSVAPLALVLLASCGSTNPLGGGGGGGGGGGTTPPPAQITVPEVLSKDVTAITYDAANDRLLVQIRGLDTTPVVASWARREALDTAGYRAYAVQEDPLDRLFVGLVAQSGDGSVSAAVAGDGGQFNTFFSGGTYGRTGTFQPPTAAGSGQVSYAGRYAGLTNIPVPDGDELLPFPDGVSDELRPGQTARVEGDIFLNVNFGDNAVNGAIYNRVLVDLDFGLQSVILVPNTIAANGTFAGKAERWVVDDSSMTEIGDYGGVFGGTNAGNVAGIVALERVFYGEDILDVSAGDVIPNAVERGLFVLRQCGQSGASDICDTVRPDYSN